MSARRAPGIGVGHSGNAKTDARAVVLGRQQPVEPVAGRQFSLFGRQSSIMEGILPINRAWLSVDIIAGVTLAVLASPSHAHPGFGSRRFSLLIAHMLTNNTHCA
jgi:hypothetical protein